MSKASIRFFEALLPLHPDYVLENALDYIYRNLQPDDVFPGLDLESWALNNGFKRSDE